MRTLHRAVWIFVFATFVFAAPSLAQMPRISTTDGELTPGKLIILEGSGFGDAVGTVLVGGTAVRVFTWGSTQIAIVLPPFDVSTTLRVCQAGGINCSNFLQVSRASAPPPSSPIPQHDNGIFVSGLEEYNDATLQMMLDGARAKLAAMQVLDATAISSHIGGLQGASSQTSSFGLTVGGPPIPGVVTTANSGGNVGTTSAGNNVQQGTGSTLTTNGTTTGTTTGATTGTTSGTTNTVQVTGPSTTSTGTTNSQLQVTSPSTSMVTTQAAANPTGAPTPTSAGFTLPTGFNPSASDILTEQLQLTSDIAGYQLLLEGSLTDRYTQHMINGELKEFPRTRVTIGVPIDIRNTGNHRDEVAEVTLTVSSPNSAISHDRPIITTLLPQEKSYNVAAVTNHQSSIGGGFASSIMSVGATWLWGHQTYYVVKDQDVLAYQVPSTNPMFATFGWQFRPTLGRRYVTEGMRRVYVQLALPYDQGNTIGQVTVSTAWRRYDRKRGVIQRGTSDLDAATYSVPFDIEQYDLRPQIGDVTGRDNGDGTFNVMLAGSFAMGTILQSGPHSYSDGSVNFLRTEESILATVPESDVVLHPMELMDRSGASIEVVKAASLTATDQCFSLGGPEVTTQTSSSVLVRIPVAVKTNGQCGGDGPTDSPALTTSNLVAAVGSRVIGFRDSPFAARDATTISLVLPSDALRSSPQIVVSRPLWGPRYSGSTIVDLGASLPSITQATTVEQSAANIQLVVSGTALSGLKGVSPPGMTVNPISGANVIINVPPSAIDGGTKQLVFNDGFGGLLLIAAPNATKGAPVLTAHDPIKVGTTKITVSATGLTDLAGITYDGSAVTYSPKRPTKDTKEITITLPDDIRSKAGTYQLAFNFNKSPSANYTVTVFDAMIVQGNPAAAPVAANAAAPATSK